IVVSLHDPSDFSLGLIRRLTCYRAAQLSTRFPQKTGVLRRSLLMVGHHRVFNVEIDLLLSPIGGCDKAVETRQVQEETHQANAAGPDFDTHQMEGNHDAV